MAKKTKTPAKPREKKLKQQFLPEMDPPSIPALDDAADIYYEAMQERITMTKEEDEAKTNLIEKMKAEGLDLYETKHGLVVSILNKSNLKCKKKKDAEEGEESDA